MEEAGERRGRAEERGEKERMLHEELTGEARRLDALQEVREEKFAAEEAVKAGDVRILLREDRRLSALHQQRDFMEYLSSGEFKEKLEALGHSSVETAMKQALEAHPFPGAAEKVQSIRAGDKIIIGPKLHGWVRDVSLKRRAILETFGRAARPAA